MLIKITGTTTSNVQGKSRGAYRCPDWNPAGQILVRERVLVRNFAYRRVRLLQKDMNFILLQMNF